jgi:hypothetical protein
MLEIWGCFFDLMFIRIYFLKVKHWKWHFIWKLFGSRTKKKAKETMFIYIYIHTHTHIWVDPSPWKCGRHMLKALVSNFNFTLMFRI